MNPKFKQRLDDAFTEEQALRIVEIFEGKVQPEDYPEVDRWERSCHHRPKQSELVMAAFNAILLGHGVEAIFGADPRWPDMEYVNMGDTYNVTIVHDFIEATYKVTTMGDWIEHAERHGRTYD